MKKIYLNSNARNLISCYFSNRILFTVSKKIPDCPTDLSYMETTYGVKFKWKGKQDKDFPITGYVIGCGIVAEGGTYLYNVGPEDEEYEFSDLCEYLSFNKGYKVYNQRHSHIDYFIYHVI